MNHVPDVLAQHAEAAASLWLRRDRAVSEPHFRLLDLTKLDGQIDANLDGLRVAEDASSNLGWHACEHELRWQQPGEIFTAAILAGERNCDLRFASVIASLDDSYRNFRALVSSLGWLATEHTESRINLWFSAGNNLNRSLAVAACAISGRDPGEELAAAIRTHDSLAQARALRAVGELARRDLLPVTQQFLAAIDPRVQFSAAWSVARLVSSDRANSILKGVVQLSVPGQQQEASPTSNQYRSLQLLLRRLPPREATTWLNQLSQKPEHLRSAIIGAGVLGLPDSIPWLLHLMQTPPVARIAGEAFTMITGLDLALHKFDAPWPPGFHAGPTEDPADNNIALDEDENLPWPDAPRLSAWWQKHSPEFQPGTRHLCGQPLTADWLEHILRHGYQHQRAAAALELALLRPDQPLFNIRAPGHRQQELLGLR